MTTSLNALALNLWPYAIAAGLFLFGFPLPGAVVYFAAFLGSVGVVLMTYHQPMEELASVGSICLLVAAMAIIPYDVSLTWGLVMATTPFLAMFALSSYRPGYSFPKLLDAINHEPA